MIKGFSVIPAKFTQTSTKKNPKHLITVTLFTPVKISIHEVCGKRDSAEQSLSVRAENTAFASI